METFIQKYIVIRQCVTVSSRFVRTVLLRAKATNLHMRYSTSEPRVCHRSFPATSSSRRHQETCRIVNSNTLVVDTLARTSSYVRFKSDLTKPTSRLDSADCTRNVGHSNPSLERGLVHSDEPEDEQTRPETFGDHRVAYGGKSTFELLRGLSFFFLCRFAFITDNSVQIMAFCYKVLGQKLAEWLIRKAVYDQFVAGEGPQEVKRAADRLHIGGVASILCVPMETDDQINNNLSRDHFLDTNLDKVVASIELSTHLGDAFPMTQFRISALLAGDLTKAISRFCWQTTHDSQVMAALTESMFGRQVDFCQLPGWQDFPQDRIKEFATGLQRLGKVKDALEGRDVIALIDAETTSINPALRLLALCLMKVCNKEYAKIFHTYQAYLKVTRAHLEQDLAYASANNFGFGVKLVRGAYLVTERQLARDLGYEDPLNETFERTSASYHGCVDLLLGQAAEGSPRCVRLMVASHNEDTVRYVMARMNALGIPKDGPSVFFGQLYGMADHVSFTLGRHGYRVYKSIPFGPVLETMPYLARRAQENKAILANARRERKLVIKALSDRIMFKA